MQLEFREIFNDLQWDEYVKSLPTYSFLNSSARYRYIVGGNGRALRYGIFSNEEFVGIISITIANSKLFGKFMECKHSPILRDNKQEYWEEIKEFCFGIAKDSSCFMFRFSPLYLENDFLNSFYTKNGFKQSPTHNVDALISQQIDLRKDMEELRRDMNKTKRNLLNRLIDNPDISTKLFNDDSQFDVFRDFHLQTVKLKGYTDKPVDSLLNELREQVKDEMCYMIVGYFKGKPIGIWQCTVYGKHMHLYQACTDTSFRDKNINITYILFWEALKLGKELGCELFDLFGGVVPIEYEGRDHPWKGINDFKVSLGGTKTTYMHSRDYAISKVKYLVYYYYSWFRTSIKGHTIKW